MSLETTQMNATLPEIVAARKTTSRRARTASTDSPSAARVADAWLAKTASTGYDHLVRALILEGAAKLRPLTWANNNARGNLAKAAKKLGDEHPEMNPDWFSTRDMGCWRILENRVGKVFRSYGLDDDEKQDILHRALYGLKADLSQGEIPLWRAGKTLMDGIFDGSESPTSVCAGLAGKWFVRKALSEANTSKRRGGPGRKNIDVHEMGDRTEDQSGLRPFGRVFLDLLTDSSNAVGRKIRNFIKSTYAGSNEEPVADLYFGKLFKDGDVPRGIRKQIADRLGMSPQLVNIHLNRKILPRLGVMWERNSRLQSEVEDAVRQLGGEAPDGDSVAKLFSGIKGVNLDKFAALADEVHAILNG
tara:strand:+ start:6878 stop:7960 length:1083 start_codon:yes stop_codon:yes gene_type:complete